MGNNMQAVENFFLSQSAPISILDFSLNILATFIMTFCLSFVFNKFANPFLNKASLEKNFFMIAITTMLIISVVKSSLALSLGLVGALSIIRFRTAIKDPEEMAYLFLAISIGVGVGAEKIRITGLCITFILVVVVISSIFRKKSKKNFNFYLTVQAPNTVKIDSIVETLDHHCNVIHLKRFDKDSKESEMAFLVKVNNTNDFIKLEGQLSELDKDLKITFLDNEGVVY
jgi:uncharacterized protein YxeA